MSPQRISDLGAIIHANTRTVDNFFSDHNLVAPSGEISSPLKTIIDDEKVAEARFAVISAIHELKCLMLGPTESLMSVEVRGLAMPSNDNPRYVFSYLLINC